MTLAIGGPFEVTSKSYVIVAADRAPPAGVPGEEVAKTETNATHEQTPAGKSKHVVVILTIAALMVGIAVLAGRGKRD